MYTTDRAIFEQEVTGHSLDTVVTQFQGPNAATGPGSLNANRFVRNLNSTALLSVATVDALLGYGDRYLGNILVDPDGNVRMIDNLDAQQGVPNSVMLPGTAYNVRINLLAGPKKAMARFLESGKLSRDRGPRRFDSATRTWTNNGSASTGTRIERHLDYRCHTPGRKRKLGTAFPPRIRQCLEHFAIGAGGATEPPAHRHHLPRHATFVEPAWQRTPRMGGEFSIRRRARAMLDLGFEGFIHAPGALFGQMSADPLTGPRNPRLHGVETWVETGEPGPIEPLGCQGCNVSVFCQSRGYPFYERECWDDPHVDPPEAACAKCGQHDEYRGVSDGGAHRRTKRWEEARDAMVRGCKAGATF